MLVRVAVFWAGLTGMIKVVNGLSVGEAFGLKVSKNKHCDNAKYLNRILRRRRSWTLEQQRARSALRQKKCRPVELASELVHVQNLSAVIMSPGTHTV